MRFFTKELWQKLIDSDEVTRRWAENEWNKNCQLYQNELPHTLKNIPKCFWNSFLRRNGLHDYEITGLYITNDKKHKKSFEFRLTNGVETVLVTLRGLESVRIDIKSFSNCIQHRLSWGYCEFVVTASNMLQLSLICDIENEMEFVFQSIRLTLLKC